MRLVSEAHLPKGVGVGCFFSFSLKLPMGRVDKSFQGDGAPKGAEMPVKGQEAEPKTRSNRLAKKIAATLAGKASAQVTVKATLTGTAAEVWLAIQRDAEGLGMDNKAILAALLDAGGAALRKALKEIPRG